MGKNLTKNYGFFRHLVDFLVQIVLYPDFHNNMRSDGDGLTTCHVSSCISHD
jgi:hypothetical protein